jgi:hypothetical protein
LFAVMLFAPSDLVQENRRAHVERVRVAAGTGQFTPTVMWWRAACLEPFYVGAGLRPYLNRRTEIEAWDIEMVLRPSRKRLGQASAPLLLLAPVA